MTQLPKELCLPIVDVLWLDSVGSSGWDSKDHMSHTSMVCRSVGFLVFEDEESITISASLSCAGEDCHGPIRIPKVAIQSHEEIRFV